MGIELKRLAALIDFKGDIDTATEEDLTNHMQATYIGRAVAPDDPELKARITGAYTGSIQTALRREMKGLGFEISDDEIKGKRLEDVIKSAFSEKISKTIKELQEAATSGDDSKFKKLQKENQEWVKKYEDLELVKATLQTEYENEKAGFATKIKNIAIGGQIKDIKNKISFSETANPLTLKGFDQQINENYTFDLEGDKLVVKDAKTGLGVKNESGNDYLTPEEVYKKEAIAAGIYKLNSGGAGRKPDPKPDPDRQTPLHFGLDKAEQNAAALKAAAAK